MRRVKILCCLLAMMTLASAVVHAGQDDWGMAAWMLTLSLWNLRNAEIIS